MEPLFADLLSLPPTRPSPKSSGSPRKAALDSRSKLQGERSTSMLRHGGKERDPRRKKATSNLLHTPLSKSGRPPIVSASVIDSSAPLQASNHLSTKGLIRRQESQRSVIPDSEEERNKLKEQGSPLLSGSQQNRHPSNILRHDKAFPTLAPFSRQRAVSVALSDSDSDDVFLAPSRKVRSSPRKRVVYSSDDEEPSSKPIATPPHYISPNPAADDVIAILDSDEEIVPDSQELTATGQDGGQKATSHSDYSQTYRLEEWESQIEEWSDDGAVINYKSNKSPSKICTSDSSGFVKSKPPTPPLGSPGIMSPRTALPKIQIVDSEVADSEVIEISSDSDEDAETDISQNKPATTISPTKNGKRRLDIFDPFGAVTASPSTPRTNSGSKSTRLGTVTPTSPSGKALSKVARARYLEGYARELFDDLNEHVFNNLLDGCVIVWSKLLSSTAGKAFLKKEKAIGGILITNPDGSTKYGLKIELSTKVVDREERVRNTLSHEMCHLSTWIVDGVDSPDHGSAWKKWVNRVQRYRREIEISTRHTYEIAYKYSWQCTNSSCGHIYGRFSKSINVETQGCGLCRNPLKALFETSTLKKSAYNEFVKVQMKIIQADNPGMTGAAAMKLVAERWKKEKAKAITDGDVDGLVAGMGRLLV
ncbi:hypothetical protein FRC02_000033 [Tulasnella sp. 418]|nr:hypothetical protein FRC02_000033 [Tulasnella sp. 418]